MPRIVQSEERRAEVVEAAFRLLARDGVEGLSMRAVAKEAGCTIGLLNHWFDSKDDLVEAAFARAVDAAVERSRALREHDASVHDSLREFLPLDDDRAEELRVGVAFWALGIGRPELRERHAERYRGLRQELKRDARIHDVPDTPDNPVADLLIPLLDGLAVNALLDPGHWSARRQQRVLAWALDALGA